MIHQSLQVKCGNLICACGKKVSNKECTVLNFFCQKMPDNSRKCYTGLSKSRKFQKSVEISRHFYKNSRIVLEISTIFQKCLQFVQKFLENFQKILDISRNVLEFFQKFLEISRNFQKFLEISRNSQKCPGACPVKFPEKFL